MNLRLVTSVERREIYRVIEYKLAINTHNNSYTFTARTFNLWVCLRDHRDSAYYHDIVKCLLAGYFMNVAVQGLAQKYWTFRVLTLDEATDGSKTKAVHIIDKASCHPTSVFYKGNGRNWLIYHQIQPSHTTQLRTLTAIQPAWLTQANPHYYDVGALAHDKSPIAKVLIATAGSQ